jgi:hypothetical protein
MSRPKLVLCAGCGGDIHDELVVTDALYAREAQISWCQPFFRKFDPVSGAHGGGTHHDPQEIFRTGVVLCVECWRRREGTTKSQSLWGYFDRVATTLRQLSSVWVRPPADLRRDLFGNDIQRERRVG